MLAKKLRNLTMRALYENRRNCLKKIAVKIQVTQFVMLLCFSFLLLPFLHATAEGEELNYTGTYSGEDGYSIVDVPFTLSTPAVTNVYYGAACENVENARLYIRPGDLEIPYPDPNILWHSIDMSRDEEPLMGYPLSKGDYIARIRCWGTLDSDAPDWTLSVKTNPIIFTSVPEDPEPASMVATTPTHSTSFSGWLGLWGTPDDPMVTGSTGLGHDISDYKFYSLKKGTRIKFRAVWDSYTASIDAQSRYDMRVSIELYRNGQTYFITNFDLLKNSGDETREITLQEDGVYKITAVDSSYIGTDIDPKEYRTYTIDVLLNGESVPGELLLTFQSAEWVKSQNLDQGYPYNLVINFQVENTYGEAKTIRNIAGVNAPGLNIVPDNDRWDTSTSDRLFVLLYYMGLSSYEPNCGASQDADLIKYYCQHDRIPEDYYIDPQDGPHNCLYYESAPVLSPNYLTPPHSKTDQTISIPATIEEYQNFDDSIQFILLGIQDKDVHLGNVGCHVHGLYFRPVKGAQPAVNHLLLKAD